MQLKKVFILVTFCASGVTMENPSEPVAVKRKINSHTQAVLSTSCPPTNWSFAQNHSNTEPGEKKSHPLQSKWNYRVLLPSLDEINAKNTLSSSEKSPNSINSTTNE